MLLYFSHKEIKESQIGIKKDKKFYPYEYIYSTVSVVNQLNTI